ncbi:DHH family phosphoesterase [Halobaculum gomorrense]|uniref:NanoRNase/pAp phosphatase, hydrolyzes c-di-AMP and oligoRNAs n=1 Tax=Halobaculum gomorrense TaxID=43928 RepID=A0A1M5RN63_9EURY|nr:DHH family phosphoesterase [Halobaculum gomorrense]SHH27705.1 nanoRNase/pAp phosphatase, hydrolyzes c-di-AMP and oligoRNAs [Halobaculum gomorrense]
MSTGVTVSSMSTYAILGCGSVGHAVADALTAEEKDVLILDKDESRVEALRDQDLNAQQQDISEDDVVEAVADRDVILILSSDVDANKEAVRAIRDRGDDQYVVVRASDPVSEDELADLGADVVINPSTVIADSALRSLESGELEYKARQLADILRGASGKLAVLAHDNPDPDSIAAAVALAAIATEYGVEADILYDGEIGHQENRAFVNTLGIDLHAREDAQPLSEYGALALVDYAETGDNEIGAEVDIYIDHDEPEEPIEAAFTDIRKNVSSTSTILTKYLQEFDLSPDETVATALLYGIRAETVDFKRDTTPADLTAAAYLHPFANHDTLEDVESPSMSPETLDVLAEAIQNREVHGSHLVSNAGFVRDREALAQAAQQLLNLEGITTSAVFGIVDDTITLAARSKDIRINIGNVLRDGFSDVGEAVGHSKQGTAEIPLGLFTGIETTESNRDTLLSLSEEAVRKKLFDAMGVESSTGSGSGSSESTNGT